MQLAGTELKNILHPFLKESMHLALALWTDWCDSVMQWYL